MKLYYCIIICLIVQTLAKTAFSQTILKENRIWSVAMQGTEGDQTFSTVHTIIVGDTIINGKTYKKAMKSWSNYPYQWQGPYGLLREDSGYIYRYYNNINDELIFYNFNLKTGDQFYFERWNENFTVDSVVMRKINGENLKHWFLSQEGTSLTAVWAEKIGSYTGLLEPFGNFMVGAWYFLLCVTDNEELIYKNEDFTSCHIVTTSIFDLQAKPNLIEPYSPSQGLLTIKVLNYTFGELQLFTPEAGKFTEPKLLRVKQSFVCPKAG